jgi:hypothetical protein
VNRRPLGPANFHYNAGTAAKTTTFAIGGARLQLSVPANGFATIKK